MKKKTESIFKFLIILIVVLLIFQPDFNSDNFVKLYENIFWIIIGFIICGFIFMVLKNSSLVYYSFISAIVLTFYLKGISNRQLVLPSEFSNSNTFKILHYNTFDYEGENIKILKDILHYSPEIVSLGELSPVLGRYLKDNLINNYPYIAELNRIDFDNKLIFSKFPINKIDTFYLTDHPQIDVSFKIKNNNAQIIFPYILPFDIQINDSLKINQLDLFTQYINKNNNPLLIVGEFNQVYWSKNMRNFIYSTSLNNARRFIYAFTQKNPYDHIFYSDDFNCFSIEDIYDPYTKLTGVKGIFELKNQNNTLSSK